ncbi:Pc13g14410 protein, related [Neospora caninum Liverpool]|uniref:Acyl-coenzyme A oxidase n=1 Tax=Neospora caninum (strain Liverpool) TaxID=572307 RepID=F0VQV2_NEOCL|nr:Pc13g14410 protein, related [Neospora caninum Liverpool]CBZ56099.1 Pc13g14410 protein, related [Neospora caninum Liverpool]|eukprot:XP_003886125.1 Pc13g14410 protein, related [Neospora caninum Liverpool]
MSGAATTELDGCVVHPDLEYERKRCSFRIPDFTYALYGRENFAVLTKLRSALARNPAFDLRYLWSADGTTQQYVRGCWLAEEVVKVIRQLKLIDRDDAIGPLQVLAGEDMFIMLHLTMFLPTLKNMCDEEQVRDLNTHESLPGVTLFHIGKKLGYNSMDNGGVQLCNVRIPRRNLLMKYCHVDRHGKYQPLGSKKLMYGTMTFTRKQIIMAAGPQLAKSVVIAIRYSAVRRQFPMTLKKPESMDNSREAEVQVLDYSTQQITLFPLLAAAVAYTVTGIWMDSFYNAFIEDSKKGDLSKLEEIHAVTSCLKAMMSLTVADGMEKCRKACGVQTARVLLKIVQRRMTNKAPKHSLIGTTLEYIHTFDPFGDHQPPAPENTPWFDLDWLLEIFKRRSCGLVYKAAQQFAAETSNGKGMMEALDMVKVEFTRLGTAHAEVLVLQFFLEAVKRVERDEVREVWVDLWLCLAHSWCDEHFGEFVITRALGPDHHDGLMVAFKSVLRKIRPNAVAIADAFWIPDQLLNSALGRYDGRVYEALLNSTKMEPLNRMDVPPGYLEHIQYILHPERRKNTTTTPCKL